MHKEYQGLAGAATCIARNPASEGIVNSQKDSPIPETLQFIDLQLDELYTHIDRLCARLSYVCPNNPMAIPFAQNEAVMKDALEPSALLMSLREKLTRIEHLSRVVIEIQRQLQI